MQSAISNYLIAITVLLFFSSCANGIKKPEAGEGAAQEISSKDYVEVSSIGMNFEMIDEISSGWTSFRYSNK
ncbi:MAG: hypothetical protein AB8B53_05725, partial [Flavobacteriales bacterium]